MSSRTTKSKPRQPAPAPQLAGVSPELQTFITIYDRLPRGDRNAINAVRDGHEPESEIYKTAEAAWTASQSGLRMAVDAVMACPARGHGDVATKLAFVRRVHSGLIETLPRLAKDIDTVIADTERLARAPASDDQLLALARDCITAHEVHKLLWLRCVELRQAAEEAADAAAMPDPLPIDDRKGYEARRDFVDHHMGKIYDEAAAASKRVMQLSRSVFAIKARSVQGVLAKLRIVVALAQGTGDAGGADLDTYQGGNRDWLAETLADFERVAETGA
jgi:hypothetical protein